MAHFAIVRLRERSKAMGLEFESLENRIILVDATSHGIDSCELCGHDTRTHTMEITEHRLVKIGPPLSG